MNETLIHRARILVSFVGAQEAARILMKAEVSAEEAFLAVMAADILLKHNLTGVASQADKEPT
jgi:hypothetical protein